MTITNTAIALTMLFSSISPSKLTITEGKIKPTTDNHFLVSVGAMRGTYGSVPRDSVAINFTYQGKTAIDVPLGDGSIRRQIGLKLHAKDTCNVIYVMWWIEPTQGINVSFKSNPGKSTHKACRDGGYSEIKPTMSAQEAIPTIRVGEEHSLQAAIVGNELQVKINSVPVWKGVLPPQALAFTGPVGIRTDNVNADIEFLTP
jgi:hypothetical protein